MTSKYFNSDEDRQEQVRQLREKDRIREQERLYSARLILGRS